MDEITPIYLTRAEILAVEFMLSDEQHTDLNTTAQRITEDEELLNSALRKLRAALKAIAN